jgi:uncharacterized tellurite resistance protein B-like protein
LRGGGGGGAAALLAAGLAIVVLGAIGVLAGRILQAAVSRQREALADASAVQFTRNPAGLANALKRIAASPLSSTVRAVRREEIGHMLFASGRRSLAGLMATHPPVSERIRALDPDWKPDDPLPPAPPPPESVPQRAVDATAGAARRGGIGGMPGLPGMGGPSGLDPVAAAAMVGVVDLAMAERLLAAVPESIHETVLEPEGAALTALALLLDAEAPMRARQLTLLETRLGAAIAARIAAVSAELEGVGSTLRLALLDLASPALHHLPEARREDLVHLAQRLVELDGVISPREAALAAALESRLSPETGGRPDAEGALAMMALLARAGHADDAQAAAAWSTGAATLGAGGFPLPAPLPAYAGVTPSAAALAAGHAARLAAMDERHRKVLMKALADVAAHDGIIRPAELQLLRSAATAFGVPMPPLDT